MWGRSNLHQKSPKVFLNKSLDPPNQKFLDPPLEQNDLKLNPEKINSLLIYLQFCKGPALDYLQIKDNKISISDKVTSLPGVMLDKHMSLITKLIIFVSLRSTTWGICLEFVDILMWMLPRWLYTCIYNYAVDYCNHLYFGLPKYKVKKLQSRTLLLTISPVQGNYYYYITPVLIQHYWLPDQLCLSIFFLSANHWMVLAHNIKQNSWILRNQLGLFALTFKTC